MKAHILTDAENIALRHYIAVTQWLSERATRGDEFALKHLRKEIDARVELERSIKRRLGLLSFEPLFFGEGVAFTR